MQINKVFIMGSGLMGRGIAQVTATAGYDVILMDVNEDSLVSAMDNVKWSLEKFKQKGKIQEEVAVIINRITATTDINAAADADYVIEVIPEVLELKQEVFKKLDTICRPEVVITTNTSAIPITVLANATNRKDKIVGTHFFNPVPMMNLVEVVKGHETSNESAQIAKQYVESIGKKACMVEKDVAGFVMNRIGICSTIEAIRIWEEGVASIEEIDQGMRLAYGWPMGPIETFDMTGLDSAMHAALSIYEETKDTKFLPPVSLQRLVAAGHFGRKTGKGFYVHTKK